MGPLLSLGAVIEKGRKTKNTLPSFRILFDEITFDNGKRAGVWATLSFDPAAYETDNFVGQLGAAVTESVARLPSAPQEIRKYTQITYHIDAPV
jgi:hypothetical protein